MNPLTRQKLYVAWKNMKRRCYDPKIRDYKYWGGKGIKVSNEWLTFENFYNDMKDTHQIGLSLDRIDGNKDYSKFNCKWSTPKEQQQNTSQNHWITFKGITDTLTNWSNFLGIKKTTLLMRLTTYGWSIDKALTTGGKYY